MEDRLTFPQIVDGLSAPVATITPDGRVDLVSQQFLDYLGMSVEELQGWHTTDAVHPDDRPGVLAARQISLERGEPHEVEYRLRRSDGVYRWTHVRRLPFRGADGRIVRWCLFFTDIEERKRSEALLDGEKHLLELVASGAALEVILEEMCNLVASIADGSVCSILLIESNGTFRHGAGSALPPGYEVATCSTPIVSSDGRETGTFAIYQRKPGPPSALLMDLISRFTHVASIAIERTAREKDLQKSERESRTIVDTVPGLVNSFSPSGEILIMNQRMLQYFGKSMDEMRNWEQTDIIHSGDLPNAIRVFTHAIASQEPFEYEARLRRFDGVYRWFQVRGYPARDSTGRVVRWYSLVTDIDALKRAEEALQSNERDLNLIINTIPSHIYVLDTEGSVQHVNQAVMDYTGLTVEDVQEADYRDRVIHPEDFKRVREERAASLRYAQPFSTEQRVLGHDGQYRWFLVRYKPLLDEQGRIVRWYVAAFDIEDRKRAEAELRALKEQLDRENLVLRDEVDRTSMFEEIVGTSKALQPVLARLAKVARTDSTVMITGETGTGKELVARAIHRRSACASGPFVSVNCAAVPRELIASELFGHEKGAFTGATLRRLGRFELAHGGTIFLDEVGELPMETQVALLRVLQERQFERVGGNASIRVDVRVIAATNRDISAAIETGAFRRDLLYRLNVFPIAVPPLRERADDITLLVEYFIHRYSRKTGKTIHRVNKRTLDHLKSYPWPGNVRELQNVIERSMIVCDTDEFRVDESWLSSRPAIESPLALRGTLAVHEKAAIEEALRACGGRVFGPSGAAERLGIPRSTLESKIRALRIDKSRFRSGPAEH